MNSIDTAYPLNKHEVFYTSFPKLLFCMNSHMYLIDDGRLHYHFLGNYRWKAKITAYHEGQMELGA